MISFGCVKFCADCDVTRSSECRSPIAVALKTTRKPSLKRWNTATRGVKNDVKLVDFAAPCDAPGHMQRPHWRSDFTRMQKASISQGNRGFFAAHPARGLRHSDQERVQLMAGRGSTALRGSRCPMRLPISNARASERRERAGSTRHVQRPVVWRLRRPSADSPDGLCRS